MLEEVFTPRYSRWFAFTGPLAGTSDVCVPRTESSESKLLILDWTAAETTNLSVALVTNVFMPSFGLNQRQRSTASFDFDFLLE